MFTLYFLIGGIVLNKKKLIFIIFVSLIIISAIAFYFYDKSKITTFGEVFDLKQAVNGNPITNIIVEDRQLPGIQIPISEADLNEIIKSANHMQIKDDGPLPPLTTYEIFIEYTEDGASRSTGFAVGSDQVLQISKNYTIIGPNYLSDAIKKVVNQKLLQQKNRSGNCN